MTRARLWIPFFGLLLAAPAPLRCADPFIRGDANADSSIDLADAVSTLLGLFLGGPRPPCLDAADVDDNGRVEITDAIRSLEFLFRGGPAPASPFPACGQDASSDTLDCVAFAPCHTGTAPRANINARPVTGTVPFSVDFDASSSHDPDGSIVEFLWDFGDGSSASGKLTAHTFDRSGIFSVTLTVRDDSGETDTAIQRINARDPGIPPDPVDIAPELDGTSIPPFGDLVSFLLTSSDPVQTGVAPGVIIPRRAAVVRGKVLTREGVPLAGVVVAALNQPELGSTATRADGMFDLVVNGGGTLTLDYQRDGFLPAQRQVDTAWQDYRWVSDVAMIPLDDRVTAIDPAGGLQVARGSPVTDADGTRQATLLFPAGTTAEMVLPGGLRQPLPTLHVRATEYTVGERGLAAMPADLPPTSGYTYCVELTVDEALARGATSVHFSSPLPFYLENFLDFPVGTPVPLGGYDRTRGAWIPQESGKVIQILGVTANAADLDVNGDGASDTGAALEALSITDAERQRLATLYSPGQSLWRVLVPHFSDLNLPLVPPSDAEPGSEDPETGKPLDKCCSQSGNSVIEIENQILGESVEVIGTPFTLHYQSERVPGRRQAYTLEIPLSGEAVPASLKRIELEISIAGRFLTQSFSRSPGQATRFVWDGRNAYGQVLQGLQPVRARIGYVYDSVYGSATRFGDSGPAISSSRGRREITLWRSWEGKIGSWDARGFGLGGWSLSAHHAYDPGEQVLTLGNGARLSTKAIGSTITTYAGGGANLGDGGPATQALIAPAGLAFGPDGSLFIVTTLARRVRRVDSDGIISTVAGGGSPQSGNGDGGPAAQADLGNPLSVALGQDGSLYIGQAQAGQQVIRKVAPDGTISTFAGNGGSGISGDGGPANLAGIGSVGSLAVGPDQSVYLVAGGSRRVRRVSPDGILSTVAGTGISGFSGDGGLATLAQLVDPQGIAVGRDGSLYIADSGAHRVRVVTTAGIIRTIAGTGTTGSIGDGGPALNAQLSTPTAVAVGLDDTLYIADSGNNRVRWMRPGGLINTLAGNQLSGSTGDGGAARQASLQELQLGIAVGPDGGICVSQQANNPRVRRISPPADLSRAGVSGELIVPAADGTEIYVFDVNGRHLRTLDALTSALIFRFNYDGAGRLSQIIDGDDNTTVIERDESGSPLAIVGPYGHVTGLELNGNGYLERVTDPAGESVVSTYTPDGLLTSFTNARGHTSSYAYDALGNLVAATDPLGATKTLVRTGTDEDFTVLMTTARGQVATHRVETFENGDQRRSIVDCAGSDSVSVIGADGRLSNTYADGTHVDVVFGPDPRWGMRAPIAASVTTTTPGGLVARVKVQRSATLSSPGDVLHLQTLTESVTTNDRTWISTYDGENRILEQFSPAGRSRSITLDERGRPVAAQVGDLDPVFLTYDTPGRVATVEQGTGGARRSAVLAYGPDGFLAGTTDSLGLSVALLRDDGGRVTEATLPGDRTFRFSYDGNGNLLGLTPPGRPGHSFTYTTRNDVATYAPPPLGAELGELRYAYDVDGNWTRLVPPGGAPVEFQHEAGTCHVSLVDLGGRQRVYDYDAAGRVTSLESSDGISLNHTFDGEILTRKTWSGGVAGSVSEAHDDDFRVSTVSVNDVDPITVNYDVDGLPVRVGELEILRSPTTGLITGMALGAIVDSVALDSFGSPVSFTATHAGVAVYSVTYTRDVLGRIVQKHETTGGISRTLAYTFDIAGRLAEARRDGALLARYTHDANGNRLSRTDDVGTLTATHDARDQLVRYGATTYTYNARGEQVSKTSDGRTTAYRYEGLGSLVGVTLPDGVQIEYLLDAADRRVGKRVNGALVQAFLYADGLRPIAELDGAGLVTSRFVYATERNVPDYMVKGGVSFRIITDQLGSPRLVLNAATGQVAQRMDHDELGRVTLDTNPGFQPFSFAGGLHDRETGLVHFGAREYDPETGRWITRDPILFEGGDGNLYAYAGNDPVNNIDPAGLCFTTLCGCLKQPIVCGAAGLQAVSGRLQRAGQAGCNAVRNLGSRPPPQPPSPSAFERSYREMLKYDVGGKIEVVNPAGAAANGARGLRYRGN